MSGASETAFAKLNLALHVRGRRPDGYHFIETLFAFCRDGDELRASPAEELTLSASGPFANELPPVEDNLVLRAARALQERTGHRGGAALELHKALPVAAGLGGGSADAAAALRLLNRIWELGLSLVDLEPIAASLGADVPACLHSKSMRAEGRGDRLTPAEEPALSNAPVLLVNPRVALPTAEAFERWDGVDRGALDDWRNGRNDLETAASELVPQVGTVIAWLSVQPGAEVVRLSGSGASCFALFDSEASRDAAAQGVPREWWRMATALR